ncbi:phenylalanine--tRNA ligase subunit beta [Heyndrickxia sporothermodurans]|uniref:Phenylalanine--tRNA ligase beta subunit n=1 Tax=Heyndrickxia sporothermodurans TaxID=46224 RepID=A0AB37H5A6_9BACI|nr:phenylalanine--tRNA ligase subunit beta [Heyndrickxia sporothermodurans]MBL5766284.1 phenylalanine--tRNA ligase subunit beta [Heyndrickxia sporothermodurans]MBL5769724.1 phenylalanine--tRNA ligase subunit beta [Heyndrickxia sporothermodurans]MBL5773424.1 phenylalanine--tRNA ligase subunit beta [Heyndrickxia sporothermodurans]MBL5777810.1 phenylalanine--tRNA ligase subunit beta [Heyndrickxia sporothermodurans]MBL5781349.1 phenylalanine--tRNA ligase subunit beta [Heyndrickxia sporothermoduran
MLVSYKWLNEYVDLNGLSAEELAEKITRSGIEVESVEHKAASIKGVVVGHVLECEKHPNADKLNKCLVDLGDEAPVQIICGAKNVAKGQKVAVATVGAVLPGNFKIKKSKLRGEESNGMICSLQELGIEGKLIPKDFAEGIFVFPNDVEVGSDALVLLNLDDKILELGLTPNRSDCLSMLGVAYEVAAILGTEVKLPAIEKATDSEAASDYISIKVDAPEENPLYVAKIIKNVKIGPSPLWVQTRLMSAGIRPHNNVVDITNYILLEYGQPLHAFDYNKLGSKEIVVRLAHEGEKITTLDDTERTLKASHLVITNGKDPIAMAGVMGGANSEVSDSTTTVLLESAYFNGQTVRNASKDHGLRSEASARFEKGVDPNRIHDAAERAAELMEKYASGDVLSGVVEVNTLRVEPAVIEITLSKINQTLGTTITSNEVLEIFNRLQFDVKLDDEIFTITIPTRRGDITIQEDLIEEVARLYGYDNLPTTLPSGETTPGGLTENQRKRRAAKRFLEGAGLNQAITYSLTSEEKSKNYAIEKRDPIRLAMPMSEERSHLRLSILPGLLDVVSYNLARKNDSVSIYEIGSVFLKTTDHEQPDEYEHLAGAITGLWHSQLWQGEKKAVDFYVAKGVVEGLFEKLGVSQHISYQTAQIDGMHPGRTAEIVLDNEVIGFIGQIHPQVQKELDLKETYVFELMTKPVFSFDVRPLQYMSIPRFPSITRDIALVVDSTVNAGTLKDIIETAGGSLLKEVSIFDLYEGEHMEQGKKSIAFSLKYFDPDRTLTDDEVVKAHEKVLKAVKEQTGAELRG